MAAGRMVKVFTARKRKTVPKVKFSRPVRAIGSGQKLVKLIKSISLKQSETKSAYKQAENVALYHNVAGGGTAFFVTNMLSTAQGDGQHARNGDEVIASGLGIKLWLSQKSDRPNVMYRIIIYTTPLSRTTFSFTTGSSGNAMLGIIDSDSCKVLKHKLLRPKPGDYSLEADSTKKERSTYLSFNLNLHKRKVKYQTDDGQVPLSQSNYIHMCVIPYDAYGTLTTDNIASCAYQTVFYYKDP